MFGRRLTRHAAIGEITSRPLTVIAEKQTDSANITEEEMRDLIRANFGLLAAGVATFVMMGAGQSLYGPALPVFARNLDLSLAAAGWLVSAHWIGCAFGVAFMYFKGAQTGPRHVIATMALGAALVALGPGRSSAFGGALIYGAGYGMATVVFNPRILRAFGMHGTSMLSLLNACFGIGAILSPLVFIWLGSSTALAFGLVAAFAVLTWIGAGSAGTSSSQTASPTNGHFRPRLALQLFAVVGIGIEACLIGLGPVALIDLGAGEADAARLLSAFFVAFLGARVALVFFAHLVTPFLIYLGAVSAIAVGATLATILPGPAFVAIGLAAGLLFPGFYVAASRAMGDDPRTPPIIIAAGLVGGISAPIVLGALMESIGGRGFFLTLAGFACAAAIAGVIVRQRLSELRS